MSNIRRFAVIFKTLLMNPATEPTGEQKSSENKRCPDVVHLLGFVNSKGIKQTIIVELRIFENST
jgi:hypothetical protein